ncbi:MAG: hypothetical protein H7281_06150 [Bacteriovorax sp.]|nr:hypothetical protein [Bacteriovorax sp.]
MKKIVASFIIFSSLNVLADSSSLQNQAGSDIDLSSKILVQKQLNLDNPFVIQLYSAWKVLGPVELISNQWIELILDKQYEKALALLPTIKEPKLIAIKQASELYLMYQAGHVQPFLNGWIELSSSTNFLQTELGLALDQIVGTKSTQLLMENGFYITPDISAKLAKIAAVPSKFNYSLQAFNALRTRENALVWIGKLDESDPLRMQLAQTALLHFAKAGKLGASGKIIKGIVEPILNKSSNEEELSLYFMTLGRLLYQAGAMSESKKYYDLIPQSSSYFLKARTEALWAHLKEKDYARTKGELATLELSIFDDKFHPEAYLVSAMTNVMLCQFNESRAAINRFIEVNKKWAREIDKNLKDPKALAITNNFFIANQERAKASIRKEKLISETKKQELLASIDESIKREISSQWQNRKTMLESALYKMKFVKIELISRMRAVEMHMKIAGSDEVTRQNAAPARKNQMSFPRKGALWGDELFQMSATIVNKCIRGELK